MIPDGWELKNLEEIGEFKNGINKSKEDFGFGVPFVNLMDVFGTSAIGKKNYALVNATQKETQDFNLVKGDVLFIRSSVKPQGVGLTSVVIEDIENTVYSGFIIRFRPKIAIDHSFMRYCFYEQGFRRRLLSNSTISENTNINQQALNKLTLLIPPFLEQCRIAEVLGVWDEAIDLLERLIGKTRSRKQGLMQQLLSGKKRFKEFEGSELRRYHFKDIFKRITRKNTVNNSNVLTISGTYGLINQRDFFNKRVTADNLEGYYLIEKGEFAYNKSYSNGYPLGAIKGLDRYDAGVLSTLYICFRLSDSLNSGDFMAHYFESGIFNKEIYGIAQEGARNHGLLNIGVNDFFELFLRVPSLPEQEKIAAVLSAADEEISTLEKQLAAYRQQKLGLMQQLLTGRIRI